ncbi:MAG: phosphotransferase [Paracoccaceae bacterium]
MSDRRSATRDFLQAAGWGDAADSPLAGDASARNYTRLSRKDTSETAILMDAAPASGEDVRPFLRVARHLKGLGLSAPEILAEDPENGLLLLENFCDALFANALLKTPGHGNSVAENMLAKTGNV